MRKIVLLSCLVGSLLVPALAATSGDASTELDRLGAGERFERLLELMSERAQKMQSLQARFRQITSSAVLLEPVVARGVLSYRAPDDGRWEYIEPDRMVVLFSDGVLTTYLPEEGTAERVTVADRYDRVMGLISGGVPLDKLRDRFQLTFSDRGGPHPYRIVLDPRTRRARRRVERIALEVDRRRLLPVVVEYTEPEGDTVRYELEDVRVDEPLHEGLFTLELPPDVDVRTLDALPSDR